MPRRRFHLHHVIRSPSETLCKQLRTVVQAACAHASASALEPGARPSPCSSTLRLYSSSLRNHEHTPKTATWPRTCGNVPPEAAVLL